MISHGCDGRISRLGSYPRILEFARLVSIKKLRGGIATMTMWAFPVGLLTMFLGIFYEQFKPRQSARSVLKSDRVGNQSVTGHPSPKKL